MTLDALLVGWGEQTAIAAAGRHVLAIQSLPSRRRWTPARSIFERRLSDAVAWARLVLTQAGIGKGVGRSEVTELAPPPDVEPLHWHLLTTHAIDDAASAWQAVN